MLACTTQANEHCTLSLPCELVKDLWPTTLNSSDPLELTLVCPKPASRTELGFGKESGYRWAGILGNKESAEMTGSALVEVIMNS